MSKVKSSENVKRWEELTGKELGNKFFYWLSSWQAPVFKVTDRIIEKKKETAEDIEKALIKKVKEGKYKAVSSCYGNIKHLLMTWRINHGSWELYIDQKQRILSLLTALSDDLNEDMLVTVLVEDFHNLKVLNNFGKKLDDVELKHRIETFRPEGIEIVKKIFDIINNQVELEGLVESFFKETYNETNLSPEEVNRFKEVFGTHFKSRLTTWIQDPIIVFNSEKESKKIILIEPDASTLQNNPQGDYAKIADKIEEENPDMFKLFQEFGWTIEGGNLLVGDDFAFVGTDELEDDEFNRRRVAKILNLSSWERVFIIRSTPYDQKPSFNTQQDSLNPLMFGDRQPFFHIDLFMTIAGKQDNQPGSKNRIVVGYPVALREKDLPLVQEVRYRIQEVVDQLYKWRDFEVVRNPMPFTFREVEIGGGSVKLQRQWFFTFYNNCLVEISSAQKETVTRKVWLPKYHSESSEPQLSVYDLDNKRIWEALGFNTILVGDYGLPAAQLGGLHCSVKVLQRQHFSFPENPIS